MSQSQKLRLRYILRSILIVSVLPVVSGSVFGQTVSSATASLKPAEAVAQTPAGKSPAPAENKLAEPGKAAVKPDTAKTSEATVADRLSVLEEAMRAQNAKIEKMNRIIADQQNMIKELLGKSADPSGRGQINTAIASNSASPNSASPNSSIDTAAGNDQTQTSQTQTSQTQTSQTQTIESRVKKVEDQVLKIGAVRLSGDFRLRLDGTFRRALPNPPAGFQPLPLVQNVHPTYRLRVNLDTDISKKLSFHGQLATGPLNDPLTTEQDFSATVARQPFFINEAWIDYHPNDAIQLQGGRLQEIFADNSRFILDDDVRFNGFNEKYTLKFKKAPAGFTSIEFRAGQYMFSNPNLTVVAAGSPLAQEGAVVGSIGRTSNLFHQGILANQQLNKKFSQQFGADLQLYRNQNEIQLASTATGVVLIAYPSLGITLSAPLTGTGNATTTPGGAIYTAPNYRVGRFTYRLNYAGFKSGSHEYPVSINLQVARNFSGGSIAERNAFLAALQIGKVTKRSDTAFAYLFSEKEANSIISQFTDNNLGTGSGVNIRTHSFRFDYGLSKRATFQSLFFLQNELRTSGDFPNFFVPLNAFTPRLYRFQEQIVFTF